MEKGKLNAQEINFYTADPRLQNELLRKNMFSLLKSVSVCHVWILLAAR